MADQQLAASNRAGDTNPNLPGKAWVPPQKSNNWQMPKPVQPPKPKTAMDVSYLRKTAAQLWSKQAQGLIAPGQKPALAIRANGVDTALDQQFAAAKRQPENLKAPGSQQTQQFVAQMKTPGLQTDTPAQMG